MGSLLCGCDCARLIWHFQGSELLSDYYYPWVAAHEGWTQEGDSQVEIVQWNGGRSFVRMRACDRCYPAFALIPYRFLQNGFVWAAAFSVLGGALVLLLLGLTCGDGAAQPQVGRLRAWMTGAALAGTFPFLHALERGNQIWFAAAAVAVFLAWYADERTLGRTCVRRSWVAAVCLALAFCLKVSPALLGLLYLPGALRELQGSRVDGMPRTFETCRLALLSAGTAIILFLAPWPWFGGIEGFHAWMDNAVANQTAYQYSGAVGFLPAAYALSRMPYVADWVSSDAALFATRVSGMVYLAMALLCMFRNPQRLRTIAAIFAVVGMMMTANLHFYGGLYLLPVVLLRLARMWWIEAFLWFCALQPVQVSVGALHPVVYVATLAPVLIPWVALWRTVQKCR